MKPLNFEEQIFIEPFLTPRGNYKYDYHKEQSQALLNKVRKILIKKNDSNIKQSQRQSSVDLKFIDNQIKEDINDNFYDADSEVKILNSTCLKKMLEFNEQIKINKMQEELGLLRSSIPKQVRLKKLQSTILVSKMVKAKGIDKKSPQQIQKEQLSLFLQKQKQDENLQKLKLPNLQDIKKKRNQRATIANFGDYIVPLTERQPYTQRRTSLTIMSDSRRSIPLIINQTSQKAIKVLINKINEEKSSITEQQKNIIKHQVKIKKNFDNIDIFGKLDRQEKFNYLKFEQRIFGKFKHKKKLS